MSKDCSSATHYEVEEYGKLGYNFMSETKVAIFQYYPTYKPSYIVTSSFNFKIPSRNTKKLLQQKLWMSEKYSLACYIPYPIILKLYIL